MTTRLTPEYEAEITARANAATTGPWGTRRGLNAAYTIQANPRTTRNGMETDGDIVTLTTGRTDAENYANARFIAHARDDVAALLAELTAVRTERNAFRDQRNAVFATNEKLLARVEESGQARLRAENEIRAVKRELAATQARLDAMRDSAKQLLHQNNATVPSATAEA